MTFRGRTIRRSLRAACSPAIGLAIAVALTAIATSCQPQHASEEAELRTPPATVSADHHPPPRMSEP